MWKKRAGFVIIAVLAIREKAAMRTADSDRFFAAIERESKDGRNFVKKAVNWALRHMGKCVDGPRFEKALALSGKLAASDDRTARWIGSDALRELRKKGPPKPKRNARQ